MPKGKMQKIAAKVRQRTLSMNNYVNNNKKWEIILGAYNYFFKSNPAPNKHTTERYLLLKRLADSRLPVHNISIYTPTKLGVNYDSQNS
jgi:hypothetical protein